MDKADATDMLHTAGGDIRQAEKAAAEKEVQVRSGSGAVKVNSAAGNTDDAKDSRVYPGRLSRPSEGNLHHPQVLQEKESISVMVARTAGRKAASAAKGAGEKVLRAAEDQIDPDMAQPIKAVEGAIRSGGNTIKSAADTVKSGAELKKQWDRYKEDKKIKANAARAADRNGRTAVNANRASPYGSGLYESAEYRAKKLSGKASRTALQKSKKAGKNGKDAGKALRATGKSAGMLREAVETGSEVAQAVTGGIRLASAGVKAASEAAAVVGTAGTAKIAMGVADTAVKPLKVLTKKLQRAMKRKNGKLDDGGFINELFHEKKDAAGESVGKVSGTLQLFMGIIPTVFGGMVLLLILLVFVLAASLSSLITSPLRFIYFTADQLANITEYFTDEDMLDSELYDLYTDHVADLQTQAADLREDGYRIIYDGYEGTSTSMPNNYRDVLSVFLVTCTSGSYNISDALVLTDSAKGLFQDLLTEMCSIEVQDRSKKAVISMMSCMDYINAHELDQEAADKIVSLYTSIASVEYAASGNTSQEELPEDVARYLDGLTHLQGVQGMVISSALAKLGTPYSQAQRDSGRYYDCSSFVYYCYKSAGISIVYGGANTAAAEAQYCVSNGRVVTVEELQPGDLLFYSYVANGRYKNISHVEMYLGNGLIIDCTETPGVAVRQFTADRLVLCGRPY